MGMFITGVLVGMTQGEAETALNATLNDVPAGGVTAVAANVGEYVVAHPFILV